MSTTPRRSAARIAPTEFRARTIAAGLAAAGFAALLLPAPVALAAEPAIRACWQSAEAGLYGVFNVSGARGDVPAPLPDGEYQNVLGGGPVEVYGGMMPLPGVAAVLRYGGTEAVPRPAYAPLLDYWPTSG